MKWVKTKNFKRVAAHAQEEWKDNRLLGRVRFTNERNIEHIETLFEPNDGWEKMKRKKNNENLRKKENRQNPFLRC